MWREVVQRHEERHPEITFCGDGREYGVYSKPSNEYLRLISITIAEQIVSAAARSCQLFRVFEIPNRSDIYFNIKPYSYRLKRLINDQIDTADSLNKT